MRGKEQTNGYLARTSLFDCRAESPEGNVGTYCTVDWCTRTTRTRARPRGCARLTVEKGNSHDVAASAFARCAHPPHLIVSCS